jgi:hypothetical protein
MMKSVKNARSWAATAYLVGGSWAANTAPKDYTVQTLLEAQRQVHRQINMIQAQSPVQQTAEELLRSLQPLETVIGEMVGAIKQEDAQTLARQLQYLEAEQQQLAAWMSSDGEPS